MKNRNSNKMKLSNHVTIVASLILMSFIVGIFFLLPSEQQQESNSDLKLAKSNVSINIPISKGYIDGNLAYFIATDASDKKATSSITNNTGFSVNYAPILNNIPESIVQDLISHMTYLTMNKMVSEDTNVFDVEGEKASDLYARLKADILG